jgi:hypothetical protein
MQLAIPQAMDGRHRSDERRRWRSRSRADDRASKVRMSDYRNVGVRAGRTGVFAACQWHAAPVSARTRMCGPVPSVRDDCLLEIRP